MELVVLHFQVFLGIILSIALVCLLLGAYFEHRRKKLLREIQRSQTRLLPRYPTRSAALDNADRIMNDIIQLLNEWEVDRRATLEEARRQLAEWPVRHFSREPREKVNWKREGF